MAKIVKRNIDSLRSAPVRKRSYEAPVIKRRKRTVPREYQTLEKAPRRSGGLIWFLFFIFVAAVGGFFYWSTQQQEQVDRSLEFSVTGPSQLVSGDQAKYTVSYRNIDIVPLQKIELNVRWPDGFYFDEASIDPHDVKATTWLLEDLAAGAEVEIDILGQIVGNKDDQLSAIFSLRYQPENFRSDFKEKEVIETKISDSKLELVVSAVDKTLVETEQEMKLSYKNISNETLRDLHLDILLPDDLEVNTIEPIKEGDYWVFDLEPDEEQSVVISGLFASDSASEQSLVAEIGNLVDDNFRRLARVDHKIEVINPSFDVVLEINGVTDDQKVNWGDVLRYQMEVTNNSGSDINDVVVNALVDGPLIDWGSLDTIGIYEESKISWSQTEDDSLSSWSDGVTKNFTWQVKIVDDIKAERAIENIISINIEGLADWEQVGKPVLLLVGESISFNNGIYWELGGRRVGQGLLPPQAGEDTQYLVVWSLAEANGNFESVTIETILPPEVDFVSETDIQDGSLDLDEVTQTLTWTVNNFSDVFLPSTASFFINLRPGDDNVGSAMTLLNPTTLSAQGNQEVIIKSKLLKTSDVISSSDDPIGIVE